MLEACGLTCHSVPSGAAALWAIASQPAYDVIIADLGVPGVSGAELARRLRRPLRWRSGMAAQIDVGHEAAGLLGAARRSSL